ncbi:hypothetical protein A3J90_07770 [candidate division WOR-1 bacterium RIFOXYC2_FULL_37_10]|uniref:ABC transmembrane type-2 domain-containing protein n=1 Tax=candidate division WOR-1 bacterium RIFOXYB2_FULL_37_13 TaxID=1802579 RepID=A0A1F4SE20_UNCSA|nr:MAG: hypothetical protein A2246_04115 [candidate division WOR-1 bacterium RIFOXYA2_FULL_37_7]OGC18647.1 MAG: hypothetical protein A2310_03380 [candidate division WOR-1 bacterium RIFOXYB2_FULL_37_13]OGC32430.1 MAG: hypothetical protein A3J90_07770 [candidate division WOR-1 bacterium RIFOXYC2_FULL_37_10]
MDSRLFHFVKKEFIQFFRDRRMLAVAMLAPILQIIFLGYVASTDIKHVSTAVLDQDKTSYSRTYLQSFKNSGYFNINYYLSDQNQIADLLDEGKVKLVINIPHGFGRKIARYEASDVQAIIDGSNASTAATIQNYINQINFTNSNLLLQKKLAHFGLSAYNFDFIDINSRIWYNPELKSVNYMVPAIFALILMLSSMLLTTVAIVKEKENGTMEMLIVTPLKPYEIILGKLIPFIMISFIDIALIFLVATIWFSVPMKGSIGLLFLLGGIFISTGLGLGVFISTISQTQRQAIMISSFIMMPSFILSGFVFPIANMPKFIQFLTNFIPMRYFLSIVRGLFLKGIGLNYLWPDVWPLIVFGVVILTLSIIRFKKKIG